MLADEAPDVLAVGARLGAEAGGVGGVIDGQVFGLEDFVPVDVGDRDLRRGHQEKVKSFQLEEVLLELGKLAGTPEESSIDHEGGQHFHVAVLPVWRSSMKLMRARSRSAPAPFRRAKRAPVILAARSKSRMPRFSPMSQWALGAKSNCGASPQVRTTGLSSAEAPRGTVSWGILGRLRRKSHTQASWVWGFPPQPAQSP